MKIHGNIEGLALNYQAMTRKMLKRLCLLGVGGALDEMAKRGELEQARLLWDSTAYHALNLN